MSRAFEALGFDPAPGDPDLVASQGEVLRSVGTRLDQVELLLSQTAAETWEGQSAHALGEVLHDQLGPRVAEAVAALADGAQALQAFAEELMDFQRRADALESEAQTQRDRRDAAQREAEAASSAGEGADSGEQSRALERVSEAESELERIDRDAQALATEVEERAQVMAARLAQPTLGALTGTTGVEPLSSAGVEEVEQAASAPDVAGIAETVNPMLVAAPALATAGLRLGASRLGTGNEGASMGDLAERLSGGGGSAFDLSTMQGQASSLSSPPGPGESASPEPVAVRFDVDDETAAGMTWARSTDIGGATVEPHWIDYPPTRGTPAHDDGADTDVEPG